MRLIFFLICVTSVSFVASVGLIEEFTWTRITYRWPRSGQLNVNSQQRNRATAERSDFVFEEDDNGADVANRPTQGNVPNFINYQYGGCT